jgi:hypothetical protein
MTAPLTPESEEFIEDARLIGVLDGAMGSNEPYWRDSLAAIEAAAIARDREGLVERVAQAFWAQQYRPFGRWDDGPIANRFREQARRLLALDAPEAQCRCGHAQRVHVTDVDWDEHSGCTSTGCGCRLLAIPEAQGEADRG